MPIVEAAKQVFIQTEKVGKILTEVKIATINGVEELTHITEVYDTTGQHVLHLHKTFIRDPKNSKDLKRHNHSHEALITALREECDYVPFKE